MVFYFRCIFLFFAALLLSNSVLAQDVEDTELYEGEEDDMNSTSTYSTTIIFSTGATVAPTPVPKPFPTFYVVDRQTDIVCVMVQIQAQFRIPYSRIDDVTGTAEVDFNPAGARAEGECGNTTQTISIHWRPPTMLANVTDWWNIQFTFQLRPSGEGNSTESDKVDQQYAPTSIKLIYVLEEGTFRYVKTPGRHENTLNLNSNSFLIPLNGTYHCTTEQALEFPSENIAMQTRNFKLQAFRMRNDTMFSGAGTHCPRDQVINTIVPLVVGALLLLQVITVLLAYFWTHHSKQANQRQSYEQF